VRHEIVSCILGGGKGTRLYPLTKDRSKPAVPLGGKYRLIDIPISNCINSRINDIFVLTQYNSASLNQHINHAYQFDKFNDGFVDILAAEQTRETSDWYQGTADAVRKNLKHLLSYQSTEFVIILSGDQIYNMDYRELLNFHQSIDCDVSVPVIPVNEEETKAVGIVKIEDNLITRFIEKPQSDEMRVGFEHSKLIRDQFSNVDPKNNYLASMGIYLFKRDALIKALDNSYSDFGHEVFPALLDDMSVGGYLYNGHWEDVGTISSFLRANIDFASANPKFDFFKSGIYTNSRYLPSTKIQGGHFVDSMIADGCMVGKAEISRSLIGLRSTISDGVRIEDSYLLGSDFRENDEDILKNSQVGRINIGIGSGTLIKNSIIDKNARIGKNCRICNEKNYPDGNYDYFSVKDGIIIIHKNGEIKDGTVI